MNHVGCAAREILSKHRELRPIDVLGLASLISIAEKGSPLWKYATEELIAGHYAYAVSMAEKFRNRAVPFDDLVQAACLGLVEAAERWNPYRGTAFVSYAFPWVRHYLLCEWRKRSVVTVPRGLTVKSEHTQRMLRGDDLLDLNANTQGQRHMLTDHRELEPSQTMPWEVEEFLKAHLSERDAMVFMKRMGLYGPPQTLKQIASSIGVSIQAVHQIIEKSRKVLAEVAA